MKKYFEYVIVFFLVLSCNSIYYVSTKNYYINYILIFLLVIMFLFYIVSKDFNKKKIVSTICFLFFYYMYIILFMLLNDMKDYENFIYTFGIWTPIAGLSIAIEFLASSLRVIALSCLKCPLDAEYNKLVKASILVLAIILAVGYLESNA